MKTGRSAFVVANLMALLGASVVFAEEKAADQANPKKTASFKQNVIRDQTGHERQYDAKPKTEPKADSIAFKQKTNYDYTGTTKDKAEPKSNAVVVKQKVIDDVAGEMRDKAEPQPKPKPKINGSMTQK